MKPPRQCRDFALCSILVLLGACRQEVAEPTDNSTAAATNAPAAGTAAPKLTRARYDGLCEASAAAVLDDNHFAVASDDSVELMIYRRGDPVSKDKIEHGGVTDIEGAARVGNTIFWLTSHSYNSGGNDKPKRKVLFATNVGNGPTIADAGTHFIKLREQLAARLGLDEKQLAAWLNIEGAAATPDGNLLVGLRGLKDNEATAYVVRVDGPSALVGLPQTSTAAAAGKSTGAYKLNLGGLGIRSIERVGEGARAYLILAGPPRDPKDGERASYALFWWDGRSQSAAPGPPIEFGDMVPEALIAWPDGEILILGDNGNHCADKPPEDGEPPDTRPRFFPSLSLRL